MGHRQVHGGYFGCQNYQHRRLRGIESCWRNGHDLLTSLEPLDDCQSKQHRVKAVRRAEAPELRAAATVEVTAAEKWKSLVRNQVS